MEKKIVFIAHSYHKKTKSCDFMVEYLKTFYDVEVIYDEEWETGKKIDWNSFDLRYHAVVIWQMFPENVDPSKIQNPNVVFFPMYDQAVRWNFAQWYQCKNFKIMNFSSTLHKKLTKWGFNSIYVQYFTEPQEFSPGKTDEVFFWQRFTKININTIKRFFENSDVKIHIHKTVDPGQEYIAPSAADEEKFKITYSDWFDTKEQVQKFIKTKGIYIAPRYSEGIGLSFLEAMAQGKLIVANNRSTMNEYIKHGKTGFLCNFKFPHSLRLKNLDKIQRQAYEYSKQGYGKWLIERKNIIDFINAPVKENKLRLCTRVCLPFLFIERKKIIQFKFGSNACLHLFGKRIF